MSTIFLSEEIWPDLTKAVKASRQVCDVAVAYFGAGAGRLLPLTKGSRLVVDASERAVASGQTCPDDLLKLVNQGVAVYSVPNLHAKVFVIGQTAYIGSANVSNHSANTLVEAAIRTTESNAVHAARRFVREHCCHELTPGLLQELAKLYVPPQITGEQQGNRKRRQSRHRPTLPRLLLAQLKPEDWTEEEQDVHDNGMNDASARREHPRSFELDTFKYRGKCPFKQGDVVIQVLDEGDGRVMVSPPGNVLHVTTHQEKGRQVSFIYVERPPKRRRSADSLARALGDGALKRLRIGGIVRNADFAQSVLQLWSH